MSYTNTLGNGKDESKVNLATHGNVQAATFEFGTTPAGTVFTAREPVDSIPMTITIRYPSLAATVNPTTADIVVSLVSRSETFRGVSLDGNSRDFIGTRIGTAAPTAAYPHGNPVSSLVTVSADTAYPTAYPFPAGKNVMGPTSTTGTTPPAGVGVLGPVYNYGFPIE